MNKHLIRYLLLCFCSLLTAPLAGDQVALAGPGVWSQTGLGHVNVYLLRSDASKGRVLYAVSPGKQAVTLFRSSDGGRTWEATLTPLSQITKLIAIADAPSLLTASGILSGHIGLLHSEDGGKHWMAVFDYAAGFAALVADPQRPRVLYAGSAYDGVHPAQILRSNDSGLTWQRLLDLSGNGPGGVTGLAVSTPIHHTSALLYATVRLEQHGVVIKSVDSGASWATSDGRDHGVGVIPRAIATVPGQATSVYATWSSYAGSSPLLLKSLNAGNTWSDQSKGLAGFVDPLETLIASSRSGILYGHGPELGLLQTFNDGLSWELLQPGGGLIHSVSYSNGQHTLFVGTADGIRQLQEQADIASPFATFYKRIKGPVLLGAPIGKFTGFSQLFQKGQLIYDPSAPQSPDPEAQIKFGFIAAELVASGVDYPVGGDTSTLTYAGLRYFTAPDHRIPPPAGFTQGVSLSDDGTVFIPYSSLLTRAPGYYVIPVFWQYMNDLRHTPSGWLHDIGLPMTDAIPAVVTSEAGPNRHILIQAFQRAILTYDGSSPPDQQVERANIGSDYQRLFPERVP